MACKNLLLFALPASILATRPSFQIRQVWYLSVVSILFQACVNVFLLRREFKKKLVFPEAEMTTVTGSPTPA